MGFFNAQVGERPQDDPAKPAPASPTPAAFGAALGERPQDDPARPAPAQPAPAPAAFGVALGERPAGDPAPAAVQGAPAGASCCPLCRGELLAQAGLWHCMGTCGARWLADGMGRLVDLASLPYGICACCADPQALVRSDIGHAACPSTARIHLILAGARPVLADRLPGGTCVCCAPAQPLVGLGAAVVCPARPEREYAQVDGVWQLQAASASVDATLSAIDAALRANNAKVTIYGLFDIE